MLGAIIGDICGSRYEWANIRSKQFQLFKWQCRVTDDSVMTLAIAKALLAYDQLPVEDRRIDKLGEIATASMQEMGKKYPRAGYGGHFYDWIFSDDPQPYNSWGNGASMRVSPCAYAGETLEEALALSDAVTEVTHNHPEGIKGARAITAATWLARHGKSQDEIREHIQENYYSLDFKLDQIRKTYKFDVSCQGSVPQAIEAFLEGDSFEDCIRNAISIGGDSDTIACMAGAIAEPFWGIPKNIREAAMRFMNEEQITILNHFEKRYQSDSSCR